MNQTDKRGAAQKADNTDAAGTEAMRHEAGKRESVSEGKRGKKEKIMTKALVNL